MLRDKFAMAAMQAMFSDPGLLRATSSAAKDSGITLNQMIAKSVYETADAMMKERANWDFSGDTDAAPIGVVLPSEKDAREFMAKHIHPAPVDGYQPKPKIIDGPPITNSPPRKP